MMNRPEISKILRLSLKSRISSIGTFGMLASHTPITDTASSPDSA